MDVKPIEHFAMLCMLSIAEAWRKFDGFADDDDDNDIIIITGICREK